MKNIWREFLIILNSFMNGVSNANTQRFKIQLLTRKYFSPLIFFISLFILNSRQETHQLIPTVKSSQMM